MIGRKFLMMSGPEKIRKIMLNIQNSIKDQQKIKSLVHIFLEMVYYVLLAFHS